jgi:Holliday junction resolvasome RuvABC endonuclease subunit
MLLAIDPGLVVTGWCCLSGGKLVMRDDGLPMAGSIRTAPQFGTVEDRVILVRKALRELFEEVDPDYVAIEGYRYQGERSKSTAGYAVCRILGIAEGLAAAWDAVALVLDKNAVNRALALTGEVPKARVRLMVEAVLRLRAGLLRNEHEVDACALGYAAHLRTRRAA